MINLDKPCILICMDDANALLSREITAGMEEEGIPYYTYEFRGSDLIKEAYNCSQLSKIGIAVGILKNRVVVHYNKLKESQPIYDIELKFYEKSRARSLGTNAARLFKVMPFKNLESSEDEAFVELIKDRVVNILNNSLSRGGIK